MARRYHRAVELRLSTDEFARLVASPAAIDDLATERGGLIVIDGAASGEAIAVPRLLPAVVVLVAPGEDPARAGGADLATSVGGLDAIRDVTRHNPQAATALTVLLRTSSGQRDVAEGLHAESAVYGVLQGGDEFARWRAQHPVRTRVVPTGDPVGVSRRDDTLHVVLSRPEVRNALDATLRDALVAALGPALEDPSLHVELRGAGPCFGSGGHLDEFGSRADPASAHLLRLSRSLPWLLHQLSARTQVHVHGPCRGSGVELPAFAGRVTATPDSTFALPEVSMGLVPGSGGTVSLPSRIGRARTAWLALTGTAIDASTAAAWGLVESVSG